MNKKDIAERHWQLYREHNKKIKRTVAASLVFGVVVLFNIMKPFNDMYVERAQISHNLDSLKTQAARIEATLQELGELTNVIMEVERTIRRRPWDARRLALIEKYRRLNASGGSEPSLYQSMADSAVNNIAADVMQTVYQPLADYLQHDSLANTLMPHTIQQLRDAPSSVEAWVDENLGKRWYSTLLAKTATVNALSTSLERQLNELSQALGEEKPAVLTYKRELQAKISELQKQVDLKAHEKRLRELQKRLGEILPAWTNGLISVEQVVIFFPYIIFVLLLYILGLGRSLSHHFLSATELWQDDNLRQDPLFSSNWTLVNRTTWGDIQSVGSYVLLTAAMFYFFEKGAKIVADCLVADASLAPAILFRASTLWILRTIMAAALLGLIWEAFSKKTRKF